MRQPSPFALALLLLLVPASAATQEEAASASTPPADEASAYEGPLLFEAHEPITLEIWADFDQLRDDRDPDEEKEREGRARVTAPDGSVHDLSLQVRTRGNFRLKESTCRLPNIRLNFKKGELDGTFMDGQDKLKLVGHCRDEDHYEQNLLEEYLVYRMYNQLTDRSFRVRLARVTYNDTSGEHDPETRWGFLIEDEDLLAERLGGTLLETEAVHPARMVGRNTGLVTLFQYMVGNTDFSLFQDHNAKIVDTGSEVIPVPYDFDWTGFVDAPYARPDPSLGIRDVKQRVFRGLCRPDVDYPAFYALFNEKRGAMEELIRTQQGLEEDRVEDALEYLGEFYETINDEDEARSRIEEACRGG